MMGMANKEQANMRSTREEIEHPDDARKRRCSESGDSIPISILRMLGVINNYTVPGILIWRVTDLALIPRALLLGALLVITKSAAFAAEDTCGGYSTHLYTSDKIVLTICHGPYTKIDRKRLEEWQGCDDALFQIKDKNTGETSQYADCLSEAGNQFRIHGTAFMLRHFQTTYPGLGSEPLLIETLNMETNKKSYTFEKHFPACAREDIDFAVKQVDATTAKPFNGGTYFTSVYGGFYRLRDCAKSDPQSVLTILRTYENSDLFDGEVAETLSSVVSEVELIHAAITR